MKYILKLNDMAYDRQDAIDRCYSLGKKFIEHFENIYIKILNLLLLTIGALKCRVG